MTPRKSLLGAAATLLALAVTSTLAGATVSLTNRDNRDHKLTVIEDEGSKTTDHTLRPTQVLEGICAKGCVIRLNGNAEDEYELEPNDKVSIEEGLLYYDEPADSPLGAGSSAPATGASRRLAATMSRPIMRRSGSTR